MNRPSYFRGLAFVVLLSLVAITQTGCDAGQVIAQITKVFDTLGKAFGAVSSALKQSPAAPTTPSSPGTSTPVKPVTPPKATATTPLPSTPPVAPTTPTTPPLENLPENNPPQTLPPDFTNPAPTTPSNPSGSTNRRGGDTGNTPERVNKLRKDYTDFILGNLLLKMPPLVNIGDDTVCGPIQDYVSAADAARNYVGFDGYQTDGKPILGDYFDDNSPNCLYGCQLKLVGAMMKGDVVAVERQKEEWIHLAARFTEDFHKKAETAKIELDKQMALKEGYLKNEGNRVEWDRIRGEVEVIKNLIAYFRIINNLVYQL